MSQPKNQSYFTLSLAIFFALSVHHGQAKSTCAEILKKNSVRVILKNRKELFSFGTLPILVHTKKTPSPDSPTSPQNKTMVFVKKPFHLISKILSTLKKNTLQPISREAYKNDFDIKIIDGPIAKLTESHFGTQKELTITSKIVLGILGTSALHMAFPDTFLDPEVWNQKKEALEDEIGLHVHRDDLEFYLRYHPFFWDLHKKYLNEQKQNPGASITPYLKKVHEHMADQMLLKEALSPLLQSHAPRASTYKEILDLQTQNSQQTPNFKSEQKAVLQRLHFAHELIQNENPPASLKTLQKSLRNMFSALEMLKNDSTLSHTKLQNLYELDSNFAETAQGLETMDTAIQRMILNTLIQYEKFDLHLNPDKLEIYAELGPEYKSAAIAMLDNEKEIQKLIKEIKDSSKDPYFTQSALHVYSEVVLDFEWMNEFGLVNKKTEIRTPENVLKILLEQMKQKHQLK